MVIHFFRERIKERINWSDVLDVFFSQIPNCNITSDDEQVDIAISEPSFDFVYHFYITKRSRVNSIYKLSPEYVNTNIFLEIPKLIPTFLVRKMLRVAADLAKRFELFVYHEHVQDITNFVMLDLLAYIGKETNEYVNNNPDTYYYMDQRTLSTACTYLQIMSDISDSLKVDAVLSPYDIRYDKEQGKVVLTMVWQAGEPTVFPPLLDFIYIEEDGNLVTVVPADIFYKYTRRLMHEISREKNYDYELDMELLYLKDRYAVKAKKLIKKMRKTVVSTNRFNTLKITDILEK